MPPPAPQSCPGAALTSLGTQLGVFSPPCRQGSGGTGQSCRTFVGFPLTGTGEGL